MNGGGSELPQRIPLRFRLNARPVGIWVEPRRTLLDVIRLDCGLTGTKAGCEAGNCGACTVHLDGRAVYSCLVLAPSVDGCEVTTIEGLGRPGELDPLQQAFIDHDALQCGYCTPGQIMAAKALLIERPDAGEAEVRQALAGNLCRCGAYQRIVEATLAARGGVGSASPRGTDGASADA